MNPQNAVLGGGLVLLILASLVDGDLNRVMAGVTGKKINPETVSASFLTALGHIVGGLIFIAILYAIAGANGEDFNNPAMFILLGLAVVFLVFQGPRVVALVQQVSHIGG